MITIRFGQPSKLRPTPLSKLSAFVSFSYNEELIAYMKSLGTRAYNADTKEWEVPERAVPSICKKLSHVPIQIKGEWSNQIDATTLMPDGYSFKTQPYSYQMDAILHGLSVDNFLLGDDPGLGKSRTVIDIAVARKMRGESKRCLIICGVNGLKYNWAEEVEKHSNEKAWVLGTRYRKRKPYNSYEGTGQDKLDDLNNLPDAYFIITNIETLRQLSFKEKKGKRSKFVFPIANKIQELCDANEISIVALDEFHKVKNPDSQQGRALLSISPKYAIPMSGTFLMNNPLDLYMPLYWAGYEQHSYWQYKQHYCVFGGYMNREIQSYKNLNQLQDALSHAMIRRRKHEVLELPPKVYNVEYVDLYKEQQSLYNEVLQNVRNNLVKIKLSADPLSSLIRLRQVTALPSILSDKVTKSSKMDRLIELVEEVVEGGGKAIVFSQWETMTDAIRTRLQAFQPAYITGKVNSDERMNEVHRFQHDEECKVIIGTVGAMGTGLTLTAASDVFFLDEPWNRALKDQAEDRAHRIGTKSTVRIVTLVAKDTIDEKVAKLVQEKGKLSDYLLDRKMTEDNISSIVDYLIS